MLGGDNVAPEKDGAATLKLMVMEERCGGRELFVIPSRDPDV